MKKLITIVFLGFCLLGMVFLSGCKSEDVFNINGRWTLSLNYTGWGTFVGFITFTGSETSGTLSADFSTSDWVPGTGTYTVTGTNVNFTVNWTAVSNSTYCNGTSTGDNAMNGTFTEIDPYSGTWTATR